jgi:hypothetical protein
MSDSPAVLLYDSNSKELSVKNGTAIPADTPGILIHGRDSSGDAKVAEFVDDSGVNRFQSNTKIARASDSANINPSTEETAEASRALLQTIDGDTSHIDVDLSTRATETTLASIKDTDGIKKITDQLPAGTNEIGKVAQGTKAAGADAWPQVLYDASGNTVGVVLDGALYRLQTDSKIARGSSDLVHLETLDTVAGVGRLKATLYNGADSEINFFTTPPDPTSIKNQYVKNGTNESLLVNGATTPVVFSYLADSTYDIALQEIKFTLVANSIPFGSNYFGSLVGGITNGLLVEIVSNGNTGTLANIFINEEFVNFASPGGFEWVVSSKDLMAVTYAIGGGLKLHAGTGDQVRVTVRDNLSSAAAFLKLNVKGNLIVTT